MSALQPLVLPAFNAKFVLIKYDDGKQETFFIRGDQTYGSHGAAFDRFQTELKGTGIWAAPLGGGFVYIDTGEKTVRLKGTSEFFGPVLMPDVAQKLFEQAYPGYRIINELQ